MLDSQTIPADVTMPAAHVENQKTENTLSTVRKMQVSQACTKNEDR